jgi:hypothetical protein
MKKLSMTTLILFAFSFGLIARDAGEDPLYNAVIKANIDSVKQALASGADINRQDKNGYTSLMWACAYCSDPDYAEVSKLLITEGADVNIRTNNGTTVLDYNSIVYRSTTWGNGKQKSKWDTPPDYEFLREAIDAAINQAVETEKTKY